MGHSNSMQQSHIDNTILQLDDPVAAIELIMDTYGDEIKRLVYTYMKNFADTDDVTQEVFVTVYQKLHTFHGKSALKSWIYSIAINKCKDHLRSWQNRNQRLKDKLIQFGGSPHKNNVKTPEDYVLEESKSSEMITAIMDLPLKYREVIILFYFKELTTAEMSRILHVKEATVRTRLNRGRSRLKTLISAERGAIHG